MYWNGFRSTTEAMEYVPPIVISPTRTRSKASFCGDCCNGDTSNGDNVTHNLEHGLYAHTHMCARVFRAGKLYSFLNLLWLYFNCMMNSTTISFSRAIFEVRI